MVGIGLVGRDGQDQLSVDRLPAPGPDLQQFLCLLQELEGLGVVPFRETGESLLIQKGNMWFYFIQTAVSFHAQSLRAASQGLKRHHLEAGLAD